MRAARYCLRPRVRVVPGYEYEPERGETAHTVMVQEQDEFSGLYDVHGQPLYREKEPFGFKVRE